MAKRNRNRRPQTSKAPKSGNTRYMEGMQELRRSNAAGPHGGNKPRQRFRADYRGEE